MRYSHAIIGVLLLLCCCSQDSGERSPAWQEILGRDEGPSCGRITRHPVYHAQIPLTWHREDPPVDRSNFDSTLPILTLYLDGEIEVTIHNFPADSLDARIPPGAQVARWKQQLTQSRNVQSKALAYGGYWGLYFEGEGILKGEERTVFAWALQLSAQNFQSLFISGDPNAQHFYRQMRGDYTIKAVGPPALMERHRQALHAFAQSFELIQEIPARI